MIPDQFPVYLVSWEESVLLAKKLAWLVKEDKPLPDLVIAIGRGGYVPARVVCDFLLTTQLTSIRVEHWGPAARCSESALVRFPLSIPVTGMNLLVIDDVTDTGKTLMATVEYLERQEPASIRTGVLHHKDTSSFCPDYFAEPVHEWRWIVYPWALHEDLTGFLQLVLTPIPASLAEIGVALRERFQMQASLSDLSDAAEELVRQGNAMKTGDRYRAS